MMSVDLNKEVKNLEIDLIKKALKAAESISGAARVLKLKRTTLIEKMKRYKLNKAGQTCR